MGMLVVGLGWYGWKAGKLDFQWARGTGISWKKASGERPERTLPVPEDTDPGEPDAGRAGAAAEGEGEAVWVSAPVGTVIQLDAWLQEMEAEGGEGVVASLSPEDTGSRGFGVHPEAFRLERERLQARQLEAIQRAMEDPELSEEKRWESHRLMMELLAAREKEVELEYLLRARGYHDAVVAVREDYANVVVEGILNEHDAAGIGELVARTAGISLERISIVDGYRSP